MTSNFRIHVVDDDPMIREALEAILGADFTLESFATAEASRERLGEAPPRLILLDVSLPGIDGYTYCRELKENGYADIVVTFISAHDTLEARLAGYDAGGDDFIVKPFDPAVVRRKVSVTERLYEQRQRVAEQVQSAEQLSELLMASMNDYVALVSYLGKMAGCSSAEEVAEASLRLLENFAVDGVVQTRLNESALTVSRAGTNVPLESSIMNHVRTMERIFEFKKRSVFNFDHITVMVNNMPLNDAEACGRLRDSLAIAAQGADTRLQGIEAEQDNHLKQAGIRALLQTVASSVAAIKEHHRESQMEAAAIAFQLQEDMAKSFVHLGLTGSQEQYLEELVRGHANRLIGVMERGAESQAILEKLNADLAQLSVR